MDPRAFERIAAPFGPVRWIVMFLRDEYTRTIKAISRPAPTRACRGSRLSAGKAISGAVPAIGNEPGRATLPVASAVLARAQDIALFLAFLA